MFLITDFKAHQSVNPNTIQDQEFEVFEGRSHFHAGSVKLVLNAASVLVFPQYHLVFDNAFNTIPYTNSTGIPHQWLALVKYSSEQTQNGDYTIAEMWFHKTADNVSSE